MSGLYLKEIYHFRDNQDGFFGLDVENMLLFGMTETVSELLKVYPNIRALEGRCAPRQIEEALKVLQSNRFLLPELTDSPGEISRDPAALPPVTALGLRLERAGDGMIMPPAIIDRSLEMLLRESHDTERLRLLLIVDNPDPLFASIQYVLSQTADWGKKYGKHVHVALSIVWSSLTPQMIRLIKDFDLSLEIRHGNDFSASDYLKANPSGGGNKNRENSVFRELPRDVIVTLTPEPAQLAGFSRLLNELAEMGAGLIFSDWICSQCSFRRGPTGDEFFPPEWGETLVRHSVAFSREPQHQPRLVMNAIPMMRAVLTSTKKKYGCRAGLDYLAVFPNGTVYPCHYAGEQPGNSLGNCETGPEPEGRRRFVMRDADRKPGCSLCGVRYLCGGGPLPDASPLHANNCNIIKRLAEHAMCDYRGLELPHKMGIMAMDRAFYQTFPHLAAPPEVNKKETGERWLKVSGFSMRPVLKDGDRVLVRTCGFHDLKIGDIACFGAPITCHRIIWKWNRPRPRFLEKGDGQLSGSVVPASAVVGRAIRIEKNGGSRVINLESRRRTFLHFVIALLSLVVYWVNMLLTPIQRRNKKSRC